MKLALKTLALGPGRRAFSPGVPLGARLGRAPLLWLLPFTLALTVMLAAPALALTWRNLPFPGFVVEHTLVVADYGGVGWSGRGHGIRHPQRVTHVGSRLVDTPLAFQETFESLEAGERVFVRTRSPEGVPRGFHAVELKPFPTRDLVRLFWLPYGVGWAFLIIGAWVFLLRWRSPPARAFAYFSLCTAVANGLMFDLITTHRATLLWTLALSQVGGAMVSLALVFPESWGTVARRVWVRYAPVGVSAALSAASLVIVSSRGDPWAYVQVWRWSYVYAALGILVFLGNMLIRLRTSQSDLSRQQARLILGGSLLAFGPLTVWLAAPALGRPLPWVPTLYLPVLLFFPLAIGLAILRYRLWEIDVIVNRTLVYGLVTLVLAGVFVAGVVGAEALLRGVTGQSSQPAAVISTLAIAGLFNPLRRRTQAFVDRRFYRYRYDLAQTLMAFGESLRHEVDLSELVARLQQVIEQTLQPTGTTTWLAGPLGYTVYPNTAPAHIAEAQASGSQVVISAHDPLVVHLLGSAGVVELARLDLESPGLACMHESGVRLVIPLKSQGELSGWVALGPRLGDQGYSATDLMLLRNLAGQISPAVRVAQLVQQYQLQLLERERMEQQLRVGSLIQQTLLPKDPPALPGWETAVYWQPAQAVGGDFYDYLVLPDGRLFLVIGDVSGKGVPAALVMATTRSVLRGTARRMVPPGEALARCNDLLYPEVPQGWFITCFYALLDPLSGRMQFSNAGHNLPLQHIPGQLPLPLRATGMPLGLMPGMRYEEFETVLAAGDCLLLYSDGLVEAHDPGREMFGAQRLQELVAGSDGGGMEMLENLQSALRAFTGQGWQQEDDITLVALRRVPD